MNSHYDKLYASSPVNKQSALVTHSKAQETQSEIATLQIAANSIQSFMIEAKATKRFPLAFVKSEGVRLQEIQRKLRDLKKERARILSSDFASVFVDVCRENMAKVEFERYKKWTLDKIKGG
jgi:lipase chaperone LimK